MKILLLPSLLPAASRVAFAQLASDQLAPASRRHPKAPQTESAASLPSAQPVSAGNRPATAGDSSAAFGIQSTGVDRAGKRVAASVGPTVTVSGGRVVAAPQAAAPRCCNKVTPTWCQCSLAAASHARFSILRFVPGGSMKPSPCQTHCDCFDRRALDQPLSVDTALAADVVVTPSAGSNFVVKTPLAQLTACGSMRRAQWRCPPSLPRPSSRLHFVLMQCRARSLRANAGFARIPRR